MELKDFMAMARANHDKKPSKEEALSSLLSLIESMDEDVIDGQMSEDLMALYKYFDHVPSKPKNIWHWFRKNDCNKKGKFIADYVRVQDGEAQFTEGRVLLIVKTDMEDGKYDLNGIPKESSKVFPPSERIIDMEWTDADWKFCDLEEDLVEGKKGLRQSLRIQIQQEIC